MSPKRVTPTYYNVPVKNKIQFVFIQQDNLISILKNTPLSFGIHAVIAFIDESLASRRTISLIVMHLFGVPYGRQEYLIQILSFKREALYCR